MTLELTKEDEHLVQRFMTAGGYGSPEELLVSLLHRMSDEESKLDRQERERKESWSRFEREIDLDALVKEQGVGPIPVSGDLSFPDWPDDDLVDDFIARATGCDPASDQISAP